MNENNKVHLKTNSHFFNLGFLFLIRLAAKNYFYNSSLLVWNFLIPIVMGFVFIESLPMEFLISGLVVHPVLTVGLVALTNSLATWNNSTIIRRLKLSNVSIWQIVLSFFILYFLISLLAVLWSFGFFVAFSEIKLASGDRKVIDFTEELKHVKWAEWFLGLSLLITMCLSIGIFVAFLSNRYQTAFIVGLSIYLITGFATGILISLDWLVKSKAIRLSTYFNPIFYPMRICQAAWLGDQLDINIGADIFNSEWKIIIWHSSDEIYPISWTNSYWLHAGISLAWIAVFASGAIAIYKFKKI